MVLAPGCNAVQNQHPRCFQSGKNITGSVPVELTKLSALVELRLDGNSFSGEIPDFSGCRNLQYIHLENNQLTGALPSSLGDIPNQCVLNESEVTLLSRIRHRNLVTFLGYSQQDGKNILVYEFMHNGTLKEHLRVGPWEMLLQRSLTDHLLRRKC